MSSNDKNKVDPGCAAIVAAVIGLIGIVLGAAVGAILAKSPTVQVILGAETPTLVALPNLLGIPLPQPTYTPYPTFTPLRVVVTQAPIIITTTPSSDQQSPPPGSIISVGQWFTRNNVMIA